MTADRLECINLALFTTAVKMYLFFKLMQNTKSKKKQNIFDIFSISRFYIFRITKNKKTQETGFYSCTSSVPGNTYL